MRIFGETQRRKPQNRVLTTDGADEHGGNYTQSRSSQKDGDKKIRLGPRMLTHAKVAKAAKESQTRRISTTDDADEHGGNYTQSRSSQKDGDKKIRIGP